MAREHPAHPVTLPDGVIALYWDEGQRDAAALWWRNLRRHNVKIAHLARRRMLGAGYHMVDILLLAPRS
jgi:hypothetical protein